MLIFILSTLTLTITAILGGGIFPFMIATIAAGLSIACLLTHTNIKQSSLLPLLTGSLILILLATWIPLPSGLVANFGSRRTHQNLLAEKAIQKASELALIKPATSYYSITRNRAGTARMILLIIAGATLAALTAKMSAMWKERFVLFMILLITTIAALGFISQWILPQEKNLWWIFPVSHGKPVGCFVNRNHFGGFAALFAAPAIFLAADSLARKNYFQAMLRGFCLVILCFATFMSLSKGAWLALSASMLFATAVLLIQKKWLSSIILISSIAIAVAIITLVKVPNQQLNERLGSLSNISKNQSVAMRLSTWRDSYAILRDYPFSGTGANAFRTVFPQYRKATTRKPFEHAENEYVQIPVEFGIPATIVIIAILICIAARWKSAFQTPNNALIALCVAGVLVTAATHSLTDFALRIPIYFLTVFSMIGLILSTSNIEQDTKHAFDHILPLTGLLIVLLLSTSGKSVYKTDFSDFFETASNEEICRALVWSPTSWRAWYSLCRASVAIKSDEACRFGEKCLSQATQYDPRNYALWEELACLRLGIQDIDGAREAYRKLQELRPWKQISELEIKPQ
ncbi:MAG: hypothetical protein A2283_10890 [Lentisphaerae bacterium RIFOXYA12_FULL_48_11]|nr:MAG: hypothetical protein A2283_10890 [Lentisphaerae bacterium RIFOXYA12_FULL_48_11]